MDSVAYGLSALSPSIGQAEEFISKKGIPPDQVPAFLASLGDPQLAGLIAQKQRLKQEQAKQVPPGGPQQSPPTVKDEINQQLAQIMQARQQQQSGMPPQQGQPGQPPQGGMPPPQGGPPPQGAPQGGPPVQAAAGGLMGMGLGGLDAGAMEAPRHFIGGGVVAFAPGGPTSSTVKSKEEIEKEQQAANTPATDPVKTSYEDYYKSMEDQKKAIQDLGPYKMLDDPTIAERENLLKKRQDKAQASYERSLAASRKAGWIAAMEAAGSGKSLFQTITQKVKTTEEKRLEAEKERDKLEDELDDKFIQLHQAEQLIKETNSKAAYDRKAQILKEINELNGQVLSTKNDEAKFKVQQDKIDRDYDLNKDKYAWDKDKWEQEQAWDKEKFAKEQQGKAADRALTARQITAGSSTNEDRYAADYAAAAKARGDTRTDAQLKVEGRKEYNLIGKDPTATAEKAELSGYQTYIKDVVGPAEEALRHQQLMHRSTPNHPDVIKAQQKVDQARADALKLYPTAAGRLSGSGGSSGGSSGGVDTSNPLLR
jgi:hypothetical protein